MNYYNQIKDEIIGIETYKKVKDYSKNKRELEGYSFIESEYKICDYGVNNYIDILLFNYIYNCFAVIELKVTELKKEHIGIIITKKDNKFVMNYCNNEYTYHSIYQPNKKESIS